MSPVQSNVKPTNDHSYPAYDYPVGIGTGLVAVKDGVIRDMPGVPSRQLFGSLQNGQAWPNAGGGSPNSGNVINIDHGNGEWTSYLHDSPFAVALLRGRAVKRGEVFHRSGHNGWSTGPHLHFEYWKNGVRVDPSVILNQGGNMSAADPNFVNNVYVGVLMRPEQPYNPVTGLWRDPGAQGWVGQDQAVVLQKVLESTERQAVERKYNSIAPAPTEFEEVGINTGLFQRKKEK